MFDFATHIIFALALGIMVYLLARALPRVVENPGEVPSSAFDKLVERLPLEKADRALVSVFEQSLKKSKILVHKLDGAINRNLETLRRHSPAFKERQGEQLKQKIEAMAEAVSEEPKK